MRSHLHAVYYFALLQSEFQSVKQTTYFHFFQVFSINQPIQALIIFCYCSLNFFQLDQYLFGKEVKVRFPGGVEPMPLRRNYYILVYIFTSVNQTVLIFFFSPLSQFFLKCTSEKQKHSLNHWASHITLQPQICISVAFFMHLAKMNPSRQNTLVKVQIPNIFLKTQPELLPWKENSSGHKFLKLIVWYRKETSFNLGICHLLRLSKSPLFLHLKKWSKAGAYGQKNLIAVLPLPPAKNPSVINRKTSHTESPNYFPQRENMRFQFSQSSVFH